MRIQTLSVLAAAALLAACNSSNTTQSNTDRKADSGLQLNGTWKLVSGATITQGKTDTAGYDTKTQEMIKIINDTHFAFLKHNIGGDTSKVTGFDAGGGRYELKDSSYTEHLDYYNNKNWEGKTFNFTVSLKGDTLIQQGIEKVEGAGVDRKIIEKYVKVK